MSYVIKLLISAVAVMVGAYLIPNVKVGGFGTAILVALVLSVLNVLVKPILIILSLPVTILTLGLFLLVINVIIVKLADFLMTSFDVHGFLNALLFSLALSVVNAVVDLVID